MNSDMLPMRVEATQNVSRMDGVYMYPIRPYRTDAVTPVAPVQERKAPLDSSAIRDLNYLELYSPKGMRRLAMNAGPTILDRRA